MVFGFDSTRSVRRVRNRSPLRIAHRVEGELEVRENDGGTEYIYGLVNVGISYVNAPLVGVM
jgi:hypothetical protein